MHTLLPLLKGLALGALFNLPQVCAGTVGWMLGLYEQGIYAIGFSHHAVKKSVLFLLLAGLGVGLGSWLLSNPLGEFYRNYPFPAGYFLLGAAIGCLPLLWRKAKVRRMCASAVLFPILGAGLILLAAFAPGGWLHFTIGGWAVYLVVALAGRSSREQCCCCQASRCFPYWVCWVFLELSLLFWNSPNLLWVSLWE